MKKHSRQKSFIFLFLVFIFGFLSCLSDFTDPDYFNSLYDVELHFCKKALREFFIFQDTFPENFDTISSPQRLYESVDEPNTWYIQSNMVDSVLSAISYPIKVIGTGMTIDTLQSTFIVADVVPNSPSDKIISPGEVVVDVKKNGFSGALNMTTINSLMAGRLHDSVFLYIQSGDTIKEVPIQYKEFRQRTVLIKNWVVLDTLRASYIRLVAFADTTCLIGGTIHEFRDALEKTSWATQTILDLRGNRGGQLTQCLSIISEFFSIPVKLFTHRQRTYDPMTKVVTTDTHILWTINESENLAHNRRFIVLIDDQSMGETEFLISALHSYRPDIFTIGKKTYGKSRTQIGLTTLSGGYISITTGIVTPLDGTDFDGVGIQPKIESDDAFHDAVLLIMGYE